MIPEYGFDCKGKEYQKIETGKAKDYSDQRFGRLKVLWRVKILNKDYKKAGIFWLCECDCGNIIAVNSQKLIRKDGTPTRSCGCLHKELISKLGASSRADLTGKIVNGIEFLKFNAQYKIEHNIKAKNAFWDCKCHCGKIFTVNSGEILRGSVISCGCLRTNKSKGEAIIERILEKHNIKYIYDKAYFRDLKFSTGTPGRYDFILLDENDKPYRIIEYDGEQHYKISSVFNYDEANFKELQQRDKIKNEYALQHNIPLVRIPYTQLKNLSWELIMSDEFLITE